MTTTPGDGNEDGMRVTYTARCGIVTHDEARHIASRFCAGQERRSIPPNFKQDDDLRLLAYIEQQSAPASPPASGDVQGESQVILDIGDGPDGVKFFTNAERSIVADCSEDSLFVAVSTMGSYSEFGPMLPGVTKQLLAALSQPTPANATAAGEQKEVAP